MDCSLPGSSVHGISQARVLEWIAIFLLYSKVIQLYIHTHTHTFFFIFFSILVYHRILNIVPCAIQ